MCNFVKLNLSMKEEYQSYIQEWIENGEEIVPMSSYSGDKAFPDYLENQKAYETQEGVPAGFVPAVTYFYVDDEGRILGAVNIRYRLNDFLFQKGGHIGYGVRPSERRKGYAEKMLALALIQAKELGISRALVTCDKGNIGSARTILKNKGVFENEVMDGNQIVQRYWIDLE